MSWRSGFHSKTEEAGRDRFSSALAQACLSYSCVLAWWHNESARLRLCNSQQAFTPSNVDSVLDAPETFSALKCEIEVGVSQV